MPIYAMMLNPAAQRRAKLREPADGIRRKNGDGDERVWGGVLRRDARTVEHLPARPRSKLAHVKRAQEKRRQCPGRSLNAPMPGLHPICPCGVMALIRLAQRRVGEPDSNDR